jgi:hypothetical protein
MDISLDRRQYAPATERNRDPILQVLQQVLPPQGTVLEIASGTGEHGVYFAPALAPRRWLSSEPNPELRSSILAWQQACPAANLTAPIPLDVCDRPWSIETGLLPPGLTRAALERDPIGAIVAINMIHIAPWAATLGLLAGAGRILPPGGILYLYGPFFQGGQVAAPSNIAFDQSLRAANPDWGIRSLEEVEAIAHGEGLHRREAIAMPANNLSVIFERHDQ